MDFETPDPQQPQHQPYQPTHWQPPIAPAAAAPAPAPAPTAWGPAPQPQFQPPLPPQPQPQFMQPPAAPAPAPMQPARPHILQRAMGVPADSVKPVPVVKVLSPLGMEYVFMTILLFVGAGSLMGALLVFIDGGASFASLAFPVATLLVTVPLFAYLFLRLKKLELMNPNLRLDPSKRRSTQFTQIVAFLFSIGALIGLLYAIIASIGGDSGMPLWKAILNTLAILIVAGGVFAYYWYDEHKVRR